MSAACLIITGLLLTVVVLLGERCWYLHEANKRLSSEAWLRRLERDKADDYCEACGGPCRDESPISQEEWDRASGESEERWRGQ